MRTLLRRQYTPFPTDSTTIDDMSIYRYNVAMTHVSKIRVQPKISRRIKQNLITAALQRKGALLECLLTPTETLMLAKRLAIIVMLMQGESTYRVKQSLKVSISSVLRFQRMIDTGLFKSIERELRIKNRSVSEIIELLLAAGMPSIAGPRHNRRLQRLRKGLPVDE